MSENDHVMASADAVAPRAAEARMVADIEKVWQCANGPPCPYVEWEEGPIIDPGPFQYRMRNRATYVSIGYGLCEADYGGFKYLGAPKLEVLVEWFPDVVRQMAARLSEATREQERDNIAPLRITPETHTIYWRFRPEVKWDDAIEAWLFYVRFAFVPKGAKILPMEN